MTLAQDIKARQASGEDLRAATDLLGRADEISENAHALADEARRFWCKTEKPQDFWLYVAATHEALAANVTSQLLRSDPAEEAIVREAIRNEMAAASRATRQMQLWGGATSETDHLTDEAFRITREQLGVTE